MGLLVADQVERERRFSLVRLLLGIPVVSVEGRTEVAVAQLPRGGQAGRAALLTVMGLQPRRVLTVLAAADRVELLPEPELPETVVMAWMAMSKPSGWPDGSSRLL